MFQESEIINPILSVASLCIFNHLEHLCSGLSGGFFARGRLWLPPAWKSGSEA